MAKVDPNNDGKISFAEFVAFMAEELQDAETMDDLLAQFTLLAGGAVRPRTCAMLCHTLV